MYNNDTSGKDASSVNNSGKNLCNTAQWKNEEVMAKKYQGEDRNRQHRTKYIYDMDTHIHSNITTNCKCQKELVYLEKPRKCKQRYKEKDLFYPTNKNTESIFYSD